MSELTNDKYELTNKQKKYLPLKRVIDVILSGGAIIVLSPILGALSLAIKLDSSGPVLFKQKRVGKNKELFEIWKFRTMRIDTPKDMPTHMLSNPEQYITKTGKLLRKTSLDELPQIFNIFKGQMSVIGPRPALWNQDDLIAERDRYGANNVTPGLTGWAQINGRDELEINVKAKFDGEYVEKLGLGMDVKCFLGTIGSVLSFDGVVEGDTERIHKKSVVTETIISEDKLKKKIRIGAIALGTVGSAGIGVLVVCIKYLMNKEGKSIKKKREKFSLVASLFILAGIGYSLYQRSVCKSKIYKGLAKNGFKDFFTDLDNCERKSKKILITGANSYVGVSVESWLNKRQGEYDVDTIDMIGDSWRECDFSQYNVIYHVAGIAHADVGSVSDEQKGMYYKVNTELAVEVAKKAKTEGVKQFIFMSSIIIYSGCKEKIITSSTQPKPLNFYGDSKWQADQKIRLLADESFKVVVLRPPMIYGKGSKGNYPELAKIATKLPVFPEVRNKRSMLYIDNLCEFVKLMIDNEESGVFFPQNGEYTNTSDMVQMIASVKNHIIIMVPRMSMLVMILKYIPGKIGVLATKVFANFAYEMSMSDYKGNYRVMSLIESIQLTEGKN